MWILGLKELMMSKLAIIMTYTVKPPISNQLKCKDRVVLYGSWSFTRIEPQGVSSEKRSRHVYFMEDNLLHAMLMLGYV